ncbi:hypothetical protein JK356_06490 [Streptomyces sp. 7-21]|nr:hypothetical protein [Streptomyces sp. 7-21]MBL1066326.1 hypothetical protein [Streptomyces sp. 7-21]
MNIPGTIGRPAPHGPAQDPQMTSDETARSTAARTAQAAVWPGPHQNRTRHMHLMPEALARSHMADLTREAESQRIARQLALAQRLRRRSQRLHRRAERASHRARRAMARALMQ